MRNKMNARINLALARKNVARLFALLAVMALMPLAACAGPSAVSSENFASASDAPATGPSDYRLAAGDKIRIIVFNELTLTGEFNIDSDGTVAFPLLGPIPATGKTPAELATDLQNKLGAGYLKDPKISVEVLTFRPFYILGEVNKPGQYPYAPGMTVLNAVATAEGFSYRAERRVVYIRHPGSSKEIPVRVAPDLQVAPGDTIRIGERYF